jgi:hypothetical protein
VIRRKAVAGAGKTLDKHGLWNYFSVSASGCRLMRGRITPRSSALFRDQGILSPSPYSRPAGEDMKTGFYTAGSSYGITFAGNEAPPKAEVVSAADFYSLLKNIQAYALTRLFHKPL